MRTVTFSHPKVQNLLNQNFVNTFSSTRGDPTAGMSINHLPSDPAGSCIRGNGKQNVQTIFMTPDGEIYHVATGFLSPDDLLEEAGFALQLFGKMQQVDADIAGLVASAHKERLQKLGYRDSEISPKSDYERIRNMSHGQPASVGMGSLPRSGNQSRNSMNVNNHFQRFIERQVLEDHQFSIEYPLITHQQLESDPTKLVGNGTSFFSSSSSGNR